MHVIMHMLYTISYCKISQWLKRLNPAPFCVVLLEDSTVKGAAVHKNFSYTPHWHFDLTLNILKNTILSYW